jgi:hypothetical protein
MSGSQLDLTDDPYGNEGARTPVGGRRFIGVRFLCCEVYTRVYVNRGETAYVGSCPRCGKQVRFVIGPGGTDARFFTAG